jgi:hypothetical protein
VYYIIEFSLPDNYLLSTLIIQLHGDEHEDEKYLQKLLKKVVFKSGKWDRYYLKNFIHRRIKHKKETPHDWAKRIICNLNSL